MSLVYTARHYECKSKRKEFSACLKRRLGKLPNLWPDSLHFTDRSRLSDLHHFISPHVERQTLSAVAAVKFTRPESPNHSDPVALLKIAIGLYLEIVIANDLPLALSVFLRLPVSHVIDHTPVIIADLLDIAFELDIYCHLLLSLYMTGIYTVRMTAQPTARLYWIPILVYRCHKVNVKTPKPRVTLVPINVDSSHAASTTARAVVVDLPHCDYVPLVATAHALYSRHPSRIAKTPPKRGPHCLWSSCSSRP